MCACVSLQKHLWSVWEMRWPRLTLTDWSDHWWKKQMDLWKSGWDVWECMWIYNTYRASILIPFKGLSPKFDQENKGSANTHTPLNIYQSHTHFICCPSDIYYLPSLLLIPFSYISLTSYSSVDIHYLPPELSAQQALTALIYHLLYDFIVL